MPIETRGEELSRKLAVTQSAYYVASGLWPIVSMRTFEAVTGRKKEGWLVKTVGALVAVMGIALGLAASNRRITPELKVLGASAAAALGVVDVVYPLKRRISPIYLADAVPELMLIAGWILSTLPEPPLPVTRAGTHLAGRAEGLGSRGA